MHAKAISILGATGSIGVNTLDVLALPENQQRFSIFALTANKNVDLLFQQCQRFNPRYAVMADPEAAEQLQQYLIKNSVVNTTVLSGIEGLISVAEHPETDYVMAAIVGAAGLPSALAAAKAGKRILLANKEALIMGGNLFMQAIKAHHAELLPTDSEHNAIFQCLKTDNPHQGVEKIILTASGGPFRTWPVEAMQDIKPAQALAHPNWEMGRKISVDSATLMNKGLEVIEASHLFDMPLDKIDVVVHPQSVIHSMVAYCDGSVLAQLGNPDMRTPIAHTLGWPERIKSGARPLDFLSMGTLTFEEPDLQRFPCLELACQAHASGGYANIALNAANEIAVQAFLDQHIPFVAIPALIRDVVACAESGNPAHIDDVFIQDEDSRQAALYWIKKKKM